MASTRTLDSRVFRDVCGRFATGVTVLTVDDRGTPRGMTANAVSSLSLDPLLILVCVEGTASAHEAVDNVGAFAINILAEDQRHLSDLFAVHGEPSEPMGGAPYRTASTGAPILKGTIGWIECEVWERYAGGDHTIFVGKAVEMELTQPDGAPLLFFAGSYRSLGEPV